MPSETLAVHPSGMKVIFQGPSYQAKTGKMKGSVPAMRTVLPNVWSA